MEDADGFGGNERGFGRGLGEDRIARGEGGCDLAGEDGEREVPRADADDRAERLGVRPEGADLHRVVAQEIDRFAHFGEGVCGALASLADEECDERDAGGFHRIGSAFECGGAGFHGRGGPV